MLKNIIDGICDIGLVLLFLTVVIVIYPLDFVITNFRKYILKQDTHESEIYNCYG